MNPLAGDRFRKPGPEHYLTSHAGATRPRRVREQDLPELARLDLAVFAGDAYPLFVLRQLFDVHGDRLRVLDEGDGTLCGYVLLATAQGGSVGWILGLGIEERRRGSGYGRRLMDEAVRMAAADRLRQVKLTVDPANDAAIRLYRSFGFVSGELRADYFGDGQDRLIMTLDMRSA